MDIWIGTWNLNDKAPKEASDIQGLREWIPKVFKNLDGAIPQLIVVGVQELEITERGNWEALLKSDIVPQHFTLIASQYLWNIGVLVFASSEASKLITDTATDFVGTGKFSILGNKGCCAAFIRTKLGDLAFLSCHLQHGEKKSNLIRRFESCKEVHSELQSYFDQLQNGSIFLLGDLNYRLDGERDEVMQLVSSREWKKLFPADQLTSASNQYSVLNRPSLNSSSMDISYAEIGQVTFPVTYKYSIGKSLSSCGDSGDYATVFSKKRLPAWTDRILTEKKTSNSVQCLMYKSEDSVCCSDHKPVSAWIKLAMQGAASARKLQRRSGISFLLQTTQKFIIKNPLIASGFVVVCALALRLTLWKLSIK
jgi:endonuclease/exonuclease/phosphatase family metal-dependent hydrolase